MQVLGISYSLNNNRWSSATSFKTSTHTNIMQPVAFQGGKADSYEELLRKFIDLFVGNFSYKIVPNGMTKTQFSNVNELLNFQIPLTDGRFLAVRRFLPDGKKIKKSYIAVKEFGKDAFKDFIGINFESKELIYLDKTAVPQFQFGEYKKIPSYDDNLKLYESKLEAYLKQIFSEKALPSPQRERGLPTNQVPQSQMVIPPATADMSKSTPQTTGDVTGTKRHRTSTKGRIPAILDIQVRNNISVIMDIMAKLSNVRQEHPSAFKRARINDFKNNYPPIIYKNDRTDRGVTFKFGEGRDETLKVVTMERKPLKYLCIIHTNKEGKQKHILIESGEKVIANTRRLNYAFIPQKPIPCTQDEVNVLPLSHYTQFLRDGLEKYYSELNKVLESKAPIKINMPVKGVTANPPVSDKVVNPSPVLNTTKVHEVRMPDSTSEPGLYEKILATIMSGKGLEEVSVQIDKTAIENARRCAQRYVEIFNEEFHRRVNELMAGFNKMLEG